MTTNSKRIVLIGPMPPYRGGIAHFSASLAEKLLETGHDVKVISFRKQYPKLLYPGKSEKDSSQTISGVNTEYLFSPLNLRDWSVTLRQIQTFQPDLVIYQWWTTFWTLATSWLIHKIKKSGINTKILIHNTVPHEATWLDTKLASWALRDANSFVTMKENEAKRLRGLVNPQAEILTAPHPIYRQFPSSGLSKVEVRRKLGLPIEAPIALFFGFVRPYKGLRVLIDAMAILRNEGVNIHLVVAGEFWDDQGIYENKIAELGIEEMVTIRADYIPDSEAGLYFEAADVFVAPYTGGTQSGSIKQAMGYGLPLVVTDLIADPMIRDNASGSIVVPAGDDKSLANGIKQSENYIQNSFEEAKTYQSSWSQLVNALLCYSSKKDDQV
ncbi:MAG: glycosyltransferase [Anaerolineaceae bacterium]|nr:glycosyltransferase [Anaerolineaceae bacterium]